MNRGANILAEVLSVGMTGDSHDLTAPHPEGLWAYESMKMALELGGVKPEELNYINAHGTSTPLGDVAESKAIYKLVGDNQDNLNVGSTKSYTGHLLGAAAAVEAVYITKAVMENKVPANLNIENFDENIPLKCINTEVVEREINVALSNSFGFGGHNSSLLIKKI